MIDPETGKLVDTWRKSENSPALVFFDTNSAKLDIALIIGLSGNRPGLHLFHEDREVVTISASRSPHIAITSGMDKQGISLKLGNGLPIISLIHDNSIVLHASDSPGVDLIDRYIGIKK